jgi:translation initiation factor IF-2
MPIQPTTGNLHYANRQASYVPSGSPSQRFFTHQQPPAVQHSSLFEQQRAMNNSAGRSFGRNSMPAAGPMNRPQTGGAPPAQAGGWRRFGQSENAPAMPSRPESNSFRGPNNNGPSGYQRFGEPGGARTNPGPTTAPRYTPPAARNDRPGYSAPPQGYGQGAPRYNAPAQPRYSAPEQPRYNAPPAQPHYNAPAPAPRYSAPPAAAPRYSAPAPRGGGGGGGGGGRPSGGGGGGHAGGGGGGHRR